MPETAQPAPETDEKKSRGLGSYVVWAFVAVIVYVLSSGLVLKGGFGSGNRFLLMAYEPLAWLYRTTPLHKPLGMYWRLWMPDMFDRNGDLI